MTRAPQDYASHKNFPTVYVLAGLAILAAVLCAGYAWLREPSLHGGASALLALGTLLLWSRMRSADLVLQDRLIRAEMYARLERVLGANRRADIAKLTLPQLIGLRFASDAELPTLVAEVLNGTLTERDAIKRKVRDWQPDHQRV